MWDTGWGVSFYFLKKLLIWKVKCKREAMGGESRKEREKERERHLLLTCSLPEWLQYLRLDQAKPRTCELHPGLHKNRIDPLIRASPAASPRCTSACSWNWDQSPKTCSCIYPLGRSCHFLFPFLIADLLIFFHNMYLFCFFKVANILRIYSKK